MSEATDDERDLATHRFEPEFDGPPPRVVPAELRVGPYARGRRDTVVGLGVSGLACAGASQLGFVREWGETLLPLAYLDWAGGALVTAGLFAAVYFQLARGAFEYVRSGEVLAGRVLDFETRATRHNQGVPDRWRVFARVGYFDPDTGEAREAEVQSDAYSCDGLEATELTYRAGDVATLVYLPGRPGRTLNLYGFLGLRGDLGLVPAPGAQRYTALVVGLVAAAGFGGLFWSIHAFERYAPLDFGPEHGGVMAGGAVLAGAAALAIEVTPARRRRRAALAERADRPGPAGRVVVLLLKCGGILSMGAFVAIVASLTLNGWLDGAGSIREPALVLGRQFTTHKGILRTYTVKYRLADDPPDTERSYHPGKAQFDALAGPDAVARAAPGAFGWPWLRDLEPLKLNGPTAPNRE